MKYPIFNGLVLAASNFIFEILYESPDDEKYRIRAVDAGQLIILNKTVRE